MVSDAMSAGCEIITAGDTSVILEIAKSFGSASLERDSSGDPAIIGRTEGLKYGITFHSCNNRKCDDLLFMSAFSTTGVSSSKVNEWNKTRRFGKVYLDDEGDPHIELAANLDYGICKKNLEDTFELWVNVLKDAKGKLSD